MVVYNMLKLFIYFQFSHYFADMMQKDLSIPIKHYMDR